MQKRFSLQYSNFTLNLYIIKKFDNWPRNPTNNFTLNNCLFATVKLTRKSDKSKFTYNGQGNKFDGKVYCSLRNDYARYVVIFGADNSSSSHTNNLQKNFLV